MLKNPNSLFFGNVIGAPSATIIRNILSLHFDEKLKWLVDIDWYIRLIKKSGQVVHSKKALICTIHGGDGQITQSVLTDKEIQIKEHVYLFEKLTVEHSELHRYSVFFQLLFLTYKIDTLEQLKLICPVPEKLTDFFKKALLHKNKHTFLKKVSYWYKKTTFRDYLFLLKKSFK